MRRALGDRPTASRRALLIALALLAAPRPVSAHGFEVGVLALDELSPGRFAIAWRPPEDSRRVTPARVVVRFPPHCRREHRELRCGAEGLHGTIAFDDVPDPRTPIVVRVDRLDGRRLEAVVRGDVPEVDAGRASATLAAIEAAAQSVIALDHLLVLFALVLVTGVDRRAMPALGAFVGAHVLGLALDLDGVPSAPLLATLAAGVVLLAREALQGRDPPRGWMFLAPMLGLGLGLVRPAPSAPSVLAWAALADLTVVALLATAAWLLRSRAPPSARVASAYMLGSAGALFVMERAAAMLTATS